MNDKSQIAKEIAKMGRYGDTMLAHISPHEAAMLKVMGGAGTINPHTGLPEFFRWKRVVKAIIPVAAVVIAVVAPQLIPSIGASILGTSEAIAAGTAVAGTAEVAAGAAAVSAATTAATGGNIEQIAKNAATAAVTAGISSNVAPAVNSALTSAGVPPEAAKIASSITSAAAGAAATGGDVEKAVVTAAITSTAVEGYKAATTTPPELTTPTAPTEAKATVDATKPVDYSLTAGATFPGEGLKAPELAPLPAAETIGYTPINYGDIFAPAAPSTGYKTPALQQLPPAEQIGVKPIDYENILTPETRNLPSMGGGTGLTATSEEGTPIQVAPQETSPLKQAGEAATRVLAGQYASSLYDQPSTRSASTLTSTGLFTPTSIVPTALTGIAPIARGKPILGGEDEETAGTWGSKTLRG